ncbi:pentatricopeptide repeat-containing protein At1g06710, mitochondrial-like [Phragmites australis]|uniref:pentatricopeptide repeat-containing protein At1g06710, mitochondrial-like n=1 Tax=Phragmites australis TaxID=29695 RepID=UPI002D7759A6|nr:pentatricopeptide repeat-containing protein At1g06710, mitochondrial-like [Phragmites australis]XP_062184846.1 pentatricopeptide repeat-containing protein At1g06710, mitochondrial-like [Phragmites australis]XP_062184847.1 pentatricopeptide repeat-containing protein At1g06710, mitochondrial-like [Phragmites australis]XP_062184848.1 pentatricopeptide repeat-containing protein At1g06710, mitochondrial-like [Phragmites australis]XP_062184849.1 pentatricopeptide repeat-containing protein At1g0671
MISCRAAAALRASLRRACSSQAAGSDDHLLGLVEVPELHPSSRLSPKDFAFLQEPILPLPAAALPPPEAVLISKAVRSYGADFDGKAERFLRRHREFLTDSVVVAVLRAVRDPDLCVRFFLWAERQVGYSHTGACYDSLADILCFDDRARTAERLLREIGEDDCEVLGKLLNVLVQRCCRWGAWGEALEELGRLKDFGYRPSGPTYNALLQVLATVGQVDMGFRVQKEMSESGFCMDRFTVGCFAQALCKEGRWADALDIIEREDFKLDTVLCTQMISGLMEASLFDEAISFLHRMRCNSCIPNVVTYRTLLSGFLKKNQLGWCKRIINMMMKEGCNPNPSLFNSLVHSYCNARDYPYAYKLLKRMTACGCPPGYVVYNIFIGSICGGEELPGPDLLALAEKLYEEMLACGCVLNKVNTANFARCLCGVGKFDKAFQIIKVMMRKGFVPDTSTYSKVITFLCQAMKVEKAFLLFQEMKKVGVNPDVYTYTILIDGFCKAGLIEQAQSWFDEMRSVGCSPNVVTYTALLHAYLKAKQLPQASDIFHRMVDVGCPPNAVTYSALIDGLCKAGEIQKACEVYAKLIGTSDNAESDFYFEGEGTDTIAPNVVTYGALINGLCKVHKVADAHELLDAMLSTGCEPNHIIYDALIDGFCKAGKIENAQEVFVRMSKCGYLPTVHTYTSLIDGMFKDRRLDLAMKVLSQMLNGPCTPNVVTYTAMIDGLCRLGESEKALKLLSMMEKKGCRPNVVTYTALIDGLGKAGKVDISLKLFTQMSTQGCAPNYVTYRVLINHCCAAGLLDKAHSLLSEMKQTYWPKYLQGYCCAIQGFSKKFIASLGLLEEMESHGIVPIAPVYGMLIDNFSKAGRLEKALELHKEMTEVLSSLNITSKDTYTSLIRALCLASQVEEAFELYSEMMRKGVVPELSVFVCLIKGLVGVNKWNEALQLCYSICHEGVNWQGNKSFDGG